MAGARAARRSARGARPRGGSRSAPGPRRWWAVLLGLAAVAAALLVLARGRDEGAPLGEIDAGSRARLERVLEAADREAGP